MWSYGHGGSYTAGCTPRVSMCDLAYLNGISHYPLKICTVNIKNSLEMGLLANFPLNVFLIMIKGQYNRQLRLVKNTLTIKVSYTQNASSHDGSIRSKVFPA